MDVRWLSEKTCGSSCVHFLLFPGRDSTGCRSLTKSDNTFLCSFQESPRGICLPYHKWSGGLLPWVVLSSRVSYRLGTGLLLRRSSDLQPFLCLFGSASVCILVSTVDPVFVVEVSRGKPSYIDSRWLWSGNGVCLFVLRLKGVLRFSFGIIVTNNLLNFFFLVWSVSFRLRVLSRSKGPLCLCVLFLRPFTSWCFLVLSLKPPLSLQN